MDRSFQGLLLSFILHGIVIWMFFTMTPPAVHYEAPTEIVLVEKDSKKTQTFVTETDKENVFDKLKDQARYLSQLTKRVKKQMKARENGPTQNRIPSTNSLSQAERAGRAQEKNDHGTLGLDGGGQLRQVAIGSSSIAEYIPGVEEGAFTALNTDQFTYYAFFSRVNEQVRNRWVSQIRTYMQSLSQQQLTQLAKINRQTIVEITLTRSGEYIRSAVHQSSDVRALDDASYESFRLAAPFLNPPQGLVENDGFIHLRYAFVISFRPTFGPGTY